MTSRKASSSSIKKIVGERGRHFDPQVVDALLKDSTALESR